ncbi:A-kinase-interacting protein 1 isoform X1 [Balaenoptera acutorostrata]|uniref:A-kinase-interacting protein 1 isoform X1 n=1 Tax=Balaenoptera acutorostrata TaxID=9767 RepID=A0ABM3U6J4_BALAC|nr:A-kinase-interacting protein 1 isoform X1 [Balaenoptera acutorostrata]XP_057409968.1 A-kinase-interacting protein 1 isoform X1 [Balaenoptera acutorostrata]
MENCLAAAALNGVDRRSLQRSARLGQEVLERAKRRAVDWHSVELPTGSVGVISRERPYRERGPAAGPHRLLPGEVRAPVLRDQPIHSLSSVLLRTRARHTAAPEGSCPWRKLEKKDTQPSVLPSEQWLNSWTILQVSVGNIIHLCQRKEGQPTSIVITEGSRSCTCARTLGMVSFQCVAVSIFFDLRPDKPIAEDISKDLYIEVYPGTYSVTVGVNDLTKKTHVVAVDSGQSVDLVFLI